MEDEFKRHLSIEDVEDTVDKGCEDAVLLFDMLEWLLARYRTLGAIAGMCIYCEDESDYCDCVKEALFESAEKTE